MALYLGNQKVSLRSGQDPTFDYGFDSNGRLVFANKNATEINNFLNYDSTYSEILDLSNLNKMEKVAVNGTADRKMEGLKGLLVSKNAPFTGSSPQINASYTGLNKSALVSLFESVPYNVGYTKVGSPTIVDGVLSKVTNDVQVKTDLQIPGDFNLLEFVTKIGTIWKSSSAYIPIISFGAINSQSYIFANAQDSRVILHLSEATGDTFKIDNFPFNKAQDGTGVYVKLLVQKNTSDYTYTLAYSLDKQNWTSEQFISSTMIGNKIINLLRNRVGSSGGDSWMDLNETYIKVNGVPWFGPGVTKNLVPDGTVVGDVTVKDGIASGFSENDYLKINVVPNIVTSFEFGVKVNTGNLYAYCTIFGNNSTNRHSPQIEYNSSNNYIYFTTPLSDFTWGREIKYLVSSNTNYWFKYIFENNKCSAYVSSDGISYALINQVSQPSIGWDEWMQIGADQSKDYWKGSIDLNNTYIKVGSDYIYRGMVPQVKTCSVVGCTGTADLTQEDKNIILNKGWSLTVQ